MFLANDHSVGLANFLADAYNSPKDRTSPILMVAERKIPIFPQRYRVKGLASYAGFVTKISKMFRESKKRNHDEGELFSISPFSPSSSATCENVLMILAICFLVE